MSFFAELKRRNVLRAGALYIGVAWALSQGVAQLLPVFDIPNWVVRWFVIAAIIGFPFAMLLSWFYEWTPHGIQRESEVSTDESVTRETGKKMDRWIIAVLSLAVVLLLANEFVPHNDKNAVQAAAKVSAKSIAILPLVNQGGDKGQQYFSDGLSEEMITALSQLPGLKVISRDSSFRFRDSKQTSSDIGRALGVAHLLEGSVQLSDAQVRIRMELVNAADGSTLWTQQYDRPYQDLFKLQDEITDAVAGALKTRLLGGSGERAKVQTNRPPSGSMAAYNAYLEGEYAYAQSSESSLRSAIEAFGKAADADRNYAAAFARLSMAWTEQSSTSLSGPALADGLAKAQAAADTALRLDPNLAEAHVARGYLLWIRMDWRGAQAEVRKALAIEPANRDARHLLSETLATLGRTDEAIRLDMELIETNPYDGDSYAAMAYIYSGLWQLDDAERAIRKAIALQPQGVANQANLAVILIQRGDATAALKAAAAEPTEGNRAWALALAYAASGDRARADAALHAFIDKQASSSPYNIAQVYAYRREPDQTFAWLERARQQGDAAIQYLLFDPYLLRYKDDPRFAAFCKSVGLPTPAELAVKSPVASASGDTR